jgi:excisionase family DNA binding protein
MTATAEPSRIIDPQPRYLTVREVAALARCEHKAVRRAIHLGHLKAFQPANKLLVRQQDAQAWVESRPWQAPSSGIRPGQPTRHRPSNAAAGSVAKLREIERQMTLGDV